MLDPFVNGRGNVGGGGAAAAARSALRPTSRKTCRPISRSPMRRFSGAAAAELRSALERLGHGLRRQQHDERRIRPPARARQCARPTALPPAWIITSRRIRVVGFALAGGGTNWGLADALGSGRSDAFQVGGYGITWFGPRLSCRGACLHQSLVHDQPLARSAISSRANFDGAELRRARRRRLPLCPARRSAASASA